MHCPLCNGTSTRVVDSRLTDDGDAVRRRRECEKSTCVFRFSTLEQVELLDIVIVKRNGRREQYQREKMLVGIRRALHKRPATEQDISRLTHDIERDIHRQRGGEMTSSVLGDIVAKHLKDFDEVAYIRFASVYKQFNDLETFAREVKKISGERTKTREE